jgi:GLPGLI family protein
MRYIFAIAYICIVLISSELKGQIFAYDSCQIKVNYIYNYQPEPTDTTKKIEIVSLSIGKKWVEYHNSRSFDLMTATVTNDETLNLSTLLRATKNLPKPKTHFYKVFQEVGKDCIKVMHTVPPEHAYYQKRPELNWVITNDFKTILNYTCQRATTTFAGRRYDAWFTTAIPKSYGPYKFSGLPGLILELQDRENHHYFTLLSVDKCLNQFQYNENFSFREYGDWLGNLLSQAKQGYEKGYRYIRKGKKVKIPPQLRTEEIIKEYLIGSSLLNPIEREY